MQTTEVLKKALRNPARVPSKAAEVLRTAYRRRKTHPSIITMVSLVTETDRSQVMNYYKELQSHTDLIKTMQRTGEWPDIYAVPEHGVLQYLATRVIEPDIILETGVHTGTSSYCFLQALEDNGRGELHSIDLPGTEAEPVVDAASPYNEVRYELPSESSVGRKVPEHLKDVWSLHLGRSDELMEPLLDDIGPVDLFCHDSDHSYENMMYEFEVALQHLTPGGLILSDDIDWNDSWSDFKRPHDCVSARLDDWIPNSWMDSTSIVGIAKF